MAKRRRKRRKRNPQQIPAKVTYVLSGDVMERTEEARADREDAMYDIKGLAKQYFPGKVKVVKKGDLVTVTILKGRKPLVLEGKDIGKFERDAKRIQSHLGYQWAPDLYIGE